MKTKLLTFTIMLFVTGLVLWDYISDDCVSGLSGVPLCGDYGLFTAMFLVFLVIVSGSLYLLKSERSKV